MRVLVALAAFAIAPSSVGDAPVTDPIVVVAQKARRLRFHLKRDRRSGRIRCTIKQSSGLAELDGRACDAAAACAPTARTAPELEACMAPRMTAIFKDIAASGKAGADR